MPFESNDAVFLTLSPEIAVEIQRSGLSLNQVCERANARGLVITSDPAPSAGGKEIVTAMMASAALIATATPLIVQVLQTIMNRPVRMRRRELSPVLDPGGAPVRTNSGEVVMAWRDMEVLERPPAVASVSPKAIATGFGIHIEVG